MGEIIDDLAVTLANARKAEQDAREARIAAEEAIIAQVQLGESERKTLKTDNGLKLTVQTGLNYKLDSGYLEMMDCVPVKRTEKVEIDVKAYEGLRESDPRAFAAASQYVTTKPKKNLGDARNLVNYQPPLADRIKSAFYFCLHLDLTNEGRLTPAMSLSDRVRIILASYYRQEAASRSSWRKCCMSGCLPIRRFGRWFWRTARS